MTQPNDIAAKPVNDLQSGRGSQKGTREHLEAEIGKRMRVRKLDLSTMDGVLRESAKVYRAYREGKISAAEAKTRSTLLRDHRDTMAVITERQDKLDLIERVDFLRGMHGAIAADVCDVFALPATGDLSGAVVPAAVHQGEAVGFTSEGGA